MAESKFPDEFKYMLRRICQIFIDGRIQGWLNYQDLDIDNLDDASNIKEIETILEFLLLLNYAGELFSDIIPAIKRHLMFSPERIYEKHYLEARGRIDWPRTLKYHFKNPAGDYPINFISVKQVKEFDKPENILLILTVLQIRKIAQKFLNCDNSLIHEMVLAPDSNELYKIQEILVQTFKIFKVSIFKELETPASYFLKFQKDEAEIKELEEKAKYNIERMKQNDSFMRFLDWRKNFSSFKKLHGDLSMSIDSSELFYSQKTQHIEARLFERWVFLEFAKFIRKYLKNECEKIEAKPINKKIELTIKTANFELKMFYQYTFGTGKSSNNNKKRWIDKSPDIPDILFKNVQANADDCKDDSIILDTKYYLSGKEKPAFEKMVYYLANINLKTGILLFPKLRLSDNPYIQYDNPFIQYINYNINDNKNNKNNKKQKICAVYLPYYTMEEKKEISLHDLFYHIFMIIYFKTMLKIDIPMKKEISLDYDNISLNEDDSILLEKIWKCPGNNNSFEIGLSKTKGTGLYSLNIKYYIENENKRKKKELTFNEIENLEYPTNIDIKGDKNEIRKFANELEKGNNKNDICLKNELDENDVDSLIDYLKIFDKNKNNTELERKKGYFDYNDDLRVHIFQDIKDKEKNDFWTIYKITNKDNNYLTMMEMDKRKNDISELLNKKLGMCYHV